ncbi:MAG TPA: hypothetical protein VGH65_10925 [Verrucomicrobiaceae bacterium]
MRLGAMKNIAVRRLKADAEKTEAWISAMPQFTETDKKMIRGMASLQGDFVSIPVSVGTRR